MTTVYVFFLSVSVVMFFLWTYHVCIGLNGLATPKPLPTAQAYRPFAVIVPACNEERVLGKLLDSLGNMTYPKSAFQVFVSADNCTDRTAEIARSHAGVEVFIRTGEARGKAENIRFTLAKIHLNDYHAIVFFDADNLVHPDFLSSMNNYLESEPEAVAVQGYIDTKNPRDSWITIAYAMMYMYTNRFWQLARHRCGISAQLGGTGALIASAALVEYGWETESLTEDLEFTVKLVLAGNRVHWNCHATIYDEKPIKLRAALRQRQRWVQGHFWTLVKYGATLARILVLGSPKTSRFQCLDLLIYLAMPGKMLISYMALLCILLFMMVDLLGSGTSTAFWLLAGVELLVVLYITVMYTIVAPSMYKGRLTLSYLRYFFHLHATILFVLPAHILGIFKWRQQGSWQKTEHIRALDDPEG